MSQTFLYFAYGSNMLTARLTARCPSAKLHSTGILADYRFVFNNQGSDDSAKASITPAHGQHVHGIIYEIAENEKAGWHGSAGHQDALSLIFQGLCIKKDRPEGRSYHYEITYLTP